MHSQSQIQADLFQSIELLPDQVQAIIHQYAQAEELTYQECSEFELRLQAQGYTFDFYLDAVPSNLRPIN